MSDKKEKWIYSFTVNKEVEVSKTEEVVENGETILKTRKVKDVKPVTIKVKKPNRKLVEDADIFYSSKVKEYLDAGLLTVAQAAKSIDDSGGALSKKMEEDLEAKLRAYFQTRQDIEVLRKEIQKEKTDEKEQELLQKIGTAEVLKEQISDIKAFQNSLFDNTAESKAKTKQGMWYVLSLSYWNLDKEDEFTPVFKGETFDERLASYDQYEEEEDPFYLGVINKLAFIVSFWMSSGGLLDETFTAELDNYIKGNE